jgi:hypothetical protein
LNAPYFASASFLHRPAATPWYYARSRFTTLAAADNFARSPIIEITKEQLIAMAKAISLEIAETDVENVRVRLSALLTEMESVERDLGPEMDKVEPVPPVYPREEF